MPAASGSATITRSHHSRAPRLHRIAYGLGDTGFLIVWQGAALFLLFFYIEIAGLPPLFAGAIFLAGMVWDALSDPLVAVFAERRAARGTPYGRVIAAAAPMVGLSYALMFLTLFGPVWATAVSALAAHLLFRSAYTLASMPYNALPARLTIDHDARSDFTAARVVGAAVGGLGVAVLTPLIAGALGYAVAAAVAGLAATACLLVSGLGVRETRDAPPLDTADTAYAAALGQLQRFVSASGPLQRLLVAMATATLAYAIFTGGLLFHLDSRAALAGASALLLAAPTLASLTSALAWPVLARRTSKRLAMVTGALLAAVGLVLFGFAESVIAAFAALAITGAGLAAIPVMLWSMAADTVDQGHSMTGERVEARVFGLFTFVQKLATGLAALIVAGGLALIDAAPQAGAGAAAFPLAAMVVFAPAALLGVTALLAAGHSIDRAAHAAIARALAAEPDDPAR